VHGSEYHANAKGSVVQKGVVVIRKLRSVAYTAIMMIITVAIYQAYLLVQK
jgi:hypothetical protein